MADLDEITSLIKDQGTAWQEFKTENNSRLNQLERDLDTFVKKANRPPPVDRSPLSEDQLEHKELFDAYGVQTVLVMPWAYITRPEQQQWITANEYALGAELNLLVAPVGEAFRLSKELRPDLPLLIGGDNSHPGPYGDYLRNLVIYASIMDRPPTDMAAIRTHPASSAMRGSPRMPRSARSRPNANAAAISSSVSQPGKRS